MAKKIALHDDLVKGLRHTWDQIAPDIFQACPPRRGTFSAKEVREIVADHAESFADTDWRGRRLENVPRWRDLTYEERGAHLAAAFPTGARYCD